MVRKQKNLILYELLVSEKRERERENTSLREKKELFNNVTRKHSREKKDVTLADLTDDIF